MRDTQFGISLKEPAFLGAIDKNLLKEYYFLDMNLEAEKRPTPKPINPEDVYKRTCKEGRRHVWIFEKMLLSGNPEYICSVCGACDYPSGE